MASPDLIRLRGQLPPSPAKISIHLAVQRYLETDAKVYLSDLQFKIIWDQHSISNYNVWL
jgi:hypothetical protein